MFEWDTEKAKEDKRKHKVAFEMVERFDFDTALEIDITDMREDGERRLHRRPAFRAGLHRTGRGKAGHFAARRRKEGAPHL